MDDFTQYKDFDDYCVKNKFTYREGIESLDQALESKKKAKGEI